MGDVFPGGVVGEVSLVGGVDDVLVVGHGAHELLDVAGVALGEDTEFAPGVGPGVEGAGEVLVAWRGRGGRAVADEETDELEAAEFEFEVAAAGFEDVAAFAGPLDGGLEVALAA